MGADAMVIANQNWDSLFLFNSLKILHYRHQEQATPYDIVKYTDASYVVYEAEGTKLQDGRASLTVNNDVGFIPNEATYAQTSGTTPGYFIEGPGVLMRKKYQDYYKNPNPGTDDDWTIKYKKLLKNYLKKYKF